MTPVTPVPALNNTNNNNNIKEELAWSQTDNDEDDHVFAHVTITILGLTSEDVSELDDWMKYHHYSSFQDIISEYFSSPPDLCLHSNYMENRTTTALPQLVVMQLKAFVGWMAEFYISKQWLYY